MGRSHRCHIIISKLFFNFITTILQFALPAVKKDGQPRHKNLRLNPSNI